MVSEEAARPRADDDSRQFGRFAGVCAFVVGLGGVAYSVAFVILLRTAPKAAELLSNLFLMVGGLLTTAVVIALYRRVHETSPTFALWALVLGVFASIGSAIGGAYRVANVINPPTSLPSGLPSAVDPRGFLTFAVTALATSLFAVLIVRGRQLPRALGYLGYVLSALLLIIYLGRLIILDPTNPVVLVAALLTGFIVSPAWYVWLGSLLRRESGTRRPGVFG